jgi:hypothetical protein
MRPELVRHFWVANRTGKLDGNQGVNTVLLFINSIYLTKSLLHFLPSSVSEQFANQKWRTRPGRMASVITPGFDQFSADQGDCSVCKYFHFCSQKQTCRMYMTSSAKCNDMNVKI